MSENPSSFFILASYLKTCGEKTLILYLWYILLKRFIFIIILLTAIKGYGQLPPYVPTSGLQGFWTFSGNANDVSGNGNNGTVNGASLTSDRFSSTNSAYSFNGSSNYISTGYTGILGTNPRAVSFWAKSTTSTTDMAAVAWGDNQFTPNQGTRYDCSFNYMATGPTIDGADCAITYSPVSNIFDNNWHHFVFQFGSVSTLSLVQIYQDGVLLTQTLHTFQPWSTLSTVNNFNVQFGRIIYPSSPSYFNGQLDDIGIWNRTLSLCEIQQLYTSSSPTLGAIASSTSICSGNSVTLTAQGAGGYTWSPGGSTLQSVVVTPSASTIYTVVSTCGASATIGVTVTPTPSLNASSIPVNPCAGSSLTITVSGATTYSWAGLGTGSVMVVNPSVPTTYTVYGFNGNCMATLLRFQNVLPAPTLSILPLQSPTVCSGAMTALHVSGANTYIWNPGGLTGTVVVVSPTATTIYTVTGTNSLGCTGTQTAAVYVNTNLTLTLSVSPSLICPGNSSTLTASGALNYTWLPSSTNGSVLVVTPSVPTTYTVLADDGLCFTSGTLAVGIGQNVSISTSGNLCTGSVMALFASPNSPGNVFQWVGPGIAGTSTSQSVIINQPGTYSVAVTNTLASCSGTASIYVPGGINTISLNVVPSTTAACFPGPPVNFLVSASAYLSWYPSAEVTPSTGALVSVNPSITTTYTVLATLGACTGSTTITLPVHITPTVTSIAPDSAICAGVTATLMGHGAMDYYWQPGNLTDSIITVSPNSSIVYTLTGANANCTSSTKVSLTVLPAPVITTSLNPHIICNGGSATLSASGAPNLSWLIGNLPAGSPTAVVSPSANSTYTVLGTDTSGCTSRVTQLVVVAISPTVNIISSDTSICAGEIATLTAVGATNYTWFPDYVMGNEILVSPGVSTQYTVYAADAPCSFATTRIFVRKCKNISLGVADNIDPPVQLAGDLYRIKFTVIVNNSSISELQRVSLNTDLTATFPQPMTYTLISGPGVKSAGSLLTANSLFNGNSEKDLILPATSTLSPQITDTVEFTVLLDPKGFAGTLRNSVIGEAIDQDSIVARDTSNSGFLYDPDQDGNPTNNNEASLFELDLFDLFIPEGFSPNDDGYNDLFVVRGLNGRRAKLTIFNRWGSKVFFREGTELSWDGKANVNALGHDKLPSSTYYYIFEFTEGKSKIFHGFIVMRY